LIFIANLRIHSLKLRQLDGVTSQAFDWTH